MKGDKFNLNICTRNHIERERWITILIFQYVVMYAKVYIRSDIAFVVGICRWFQSNRGLDNWRAAKKVLRHLKQPRFLCLYIDKPNTWLFTWIWFCRLCWPPKANSLDISSCFLSCILEKYEAFRICYFYHGSLFLILRQRYRYLVEEFHIRTLSCWLYF